MNHPHNDFVANRRGVGKQPLIGIICLIGLTGCVSITSPLNNSTGTYDAQGKVPAVVVWNTDMEVGTFSATLDGVDVTQQFVVDYVGRKATAELFSPPTPTSHTLVAGGKVYTIYLFGYSYTDDRSIFWVEIQ